MNTKTDGISSGLVAVAWSVLDGEHTPLVRLSDAEAIINDLQTLVIAENQRKQQFEAEVAAKAAEIERLIQFATLTDGGFNERMQTISQQAERIKDLTDDRDTWKTRAEFSFTQRDKQSAALKLAREALFDMQDSYAAVHGWKDSFVIAATTAIAAIDSLQKGE